MALVNLTQTQRSNCMSNKEHWEAVYQTKGALDLSWYQPKPAASLQLIEASTIAIGEGLIDVGGGTSVLVDCLLDAGFTWLAVLDISAAALDHARRRLGSRAQHVEWFEADVTVFNPPRHFNLWHDRAVFHFLTAKADRQKYVQTLQRTLTPDGHVIIATFAADGPLKCSGLDVARYEAPSICAELGPDFQLVEQLDETHVTPWSTEQKFSCFRFARTAAALL